MLGKLAQPELENHLGCCEKEYLKKWFSRKMLGLASNPQYWAHFFYISAIVFLPATVGQMTNNIWPQSPFRVKEKSL